ncbi:helix-turn-helix transcriptional regulator [Gilvimarinus xylanilyticus]|uniref:helix-turn-helix transcriptional regulator n=1 Tax=Gilvimarinus xylanilyticus TaxID=2944139 RepID=UPI003AEFD995
MFDHESNKPRKPHGFYRLPEVLEIIPVSKSTWWAGIKAGRYPKPVKLSPGTTAWHCEAIHRLEASLTQSEGEFK